jgi:hypothetical protein
VTVPQRLQPQGLVVAGSHAVGHRRRPWAMAAEGTGHGRWPIHWRTQGLRPVGLDWISVVQLICPKEAQAELRHRTQL